MWYLSLVGIARMNIFAFHNQKARIVVAGCGFAVTTIGTPSTQGIPFDIARARGVHCVVCSHSCTSSVFMLYVAISRCIGNTQLRLHRQWIWQYGLLDPVRHQDRFVCY